MKNTLSLLLVTVLLTALFAGCAIPATKNLTETEISLSDNGITVDGVSATGDPTQAVYVANDIVYYEAGHDFTYGEGSEKDAHTKEEADGHTVVHITKPGKYTLSGTLSKGQIAVDLGEEAEDDPSSVVTLILNNADITSTVAPAVIFYNVYECGDDDEENAKETVGTSAAGANVIIADGSINTINASYVARIYKPGTVELDDDGKKVEDAEKLHKYDGAFYSRMSMNIDGNDGILNINAENEGLDSELHLTINGGNINIVSGNDGINTNEDNVSVTTINGGNVNIFVDGKTGEGDGIDSNGWLVINGGSVVAQGCGTSMDSGIDSDRGISINGGSVVATGNMLDRISESKQNFAVFTFTSSQNGGTYTLKNSTGATVAETKITNAFSSLIISDESITEGDYTLWKDGKQFEGAVSEGSSGRGFHGAPPEGMTPPEGMHEKGKERPDRKKPPEIPEGMNPPEGMPPREGMNRPDQKMPTGNDAIELSEIFTIKDGGNYFFVVSLIS